MGEETGETEQRAKAAEDAALADDLRQVASGSMVLEAYESLTADQQDQWRPALTAWIDPARRLASIESELRDESTPAFHVPSAEGFSVYTGTFGPNGRLSAEQKKLIDRLLLAAPADVPQGTEQSSQAS